MVRAGRIELPSSAWKTEVLPLNYARRKIMCLDEIAADGIVNLKIK